MKNILKKSLKNLQLTIYPYDKFYNNLDKLIKLNKKFLLSEENNNL